MHWKLPQKWYLYGQGEEAVAHESGSSEVSLLELSPNEQQVHPSLRISIPAWGNVFTHGFAKPGFGQVTQQQAQPLVQDVCVSQAAGLIQLWAAPRERALRLTVKDQ